MSCREEEEEENEGKEEKEKGLFVNRHTQRTCADWMSAGNPALLPLSHHPPTVPSFPPGAEPDARLGEGIGGVIVVEEEGTGGLAVHDSRHVVGRALQIGTVKCGRAEHLW